MSLDRAGATSGAAVAGVVVGVSRNETSSAAVRWASVEAASRGLELTLVHAWREPVQVSVELTSADLPDLRGTAVSRAVESANPADALLAARPDLLVLGGRRPTGYLSRVTRTCLHRATCPVVIIPETGRRPTGRIVVGVSGSGAARTALAWAAHEAELREADLVAVHAWQVRPTSPQELLFPSRAVPVQQGTAMHRLRGWVDAVQGAASIAVRVVHAAPLDAIIELSRDADLLVLGRGTHSWLAGLLHPAICTDLPALVCCPVAVIPDYRPGAGPAPGRGRLT
jgi:nucleotide-binding universal stress UspA family protein